MRFDNIDSADVVRFICGGSSCNEDCCMMRVLGKCYDIKRTWNSGESARKSLVKVIKSIHMHKTEIAENGKKLHQIDEHMLKDAESLLYGEFATVLNIKKEEVLPFIIKTLDGAADE